MLTGLIASGVLAVALSPLPPSPAGAVPQSSPTVASLTAAPVPEGPGPAFSHLFQGIQPDVKPPVQPQPPWLQPQQPQAPARARRPQARVVCGMTLILVGPQVDPTMLHATPKDDGIKYTMRRYPPPACGQDQTADGKKR